MPKIIDLTGMKFGRLIVIRRFDGDFIMPRWLCQCECGNIIDCYGNNLKKGHTTSCGCAHRDMLLKRNTKHGLRRHPLYKVWTDMYDRCYRPSNNRYINYGMRGVRVCDLWLNDRIEFIKWGINNGWQPGLQLDKDIIPKKLGIKALLYSPDYCCFVTSKENTRNNTKTKLTMEKANEIRLSTESITILMNKYGVGRTTIGNIRANRSWL